MPKTSSNPKAAAPSAAAAFDADRIAMGWGYATLGRYVGKDETLIRRMCVGNVTVDPIIAGWVAKMAKLLRDNPPPSPPKRQALLRGREGGPVDPTTKDFVWMQDGNTFRTTVLGAEARVETKDKGFRAYAGRRTDPKTYGTLDEAKRAAVLLVMAARRAAKERKKTAKAKAKAAA